MKGFENSYRALRQAIGFLGLAFPIILFAGSYAMGFCTPFQSSISCYYHTIMRNVFEGVLWIFAIILVFYQYHGKDNVITTLAGMCALGVALCPTHVDSCSTCGTCVTQLSNAGIIGNFHNVFATSFFLILAFISLFIFTKKNPDPEKVTDEKLTRNLVYIVCGVIMLLCIVLIGIYWTCLEGKSPCLDKMNPTFCMETLALWAFGFSWIVKGEIVLSDKHHNNPHIHLPVSE
jgi:hypothetical protein